jgi:hypothetical protein
MASARETRIVCAVLRGEKAAWNDGGDPSAIQGFLGACRYHGVLPLLGQAMGRDAAFRAWPQEIRSVCSNATRQQAMYELAQRAEMVRVLAALAAVDIAPLVLKGTALAHSHYPSPALRPRADTDLLIPPDRRWETAQALEALGYTKGEGMEGEFITTQASWSRTDGLGATHHLDVHWRISNSQVLARTLGYGELVARVVPLPALGPHARALAPVDALLFACIHRAGHASASYRVDGSEHVGGDRLVWLYDIHLLVTRMGDAELDEFAALASARRIKAICLDALQQTADCFATPLPARIVDVLQAAGPAEASVHFLRGGRMRQMAGDFLALQRWRDRAHWVSELAFPPAGYMRSKYPDTPHAWLPILYARRGLTGAARLIFSRGSGRGG